MISTKQHPRALRLSILVILLIPFIIGTAHSQISKKEFATEYLLNKYRNELNAIKKNKSQTNIPQRTITEQKLTDNNSISNSEVEPTIAVNPTNPDNIVVAFINNLETSVYYTLDGGQVWEASTLPIDSVYMVDHVYDEYGERGLGDPVLAFDSEGKLFFVFLYFDNATENRDFAVIAQYWSWSTDGGQSFNFSDTRDDRTLGTSKLFTGSSFIGSSLDRPWIAIDKSNGPFHGTVYIQSLVFNQDSHILGSEDFVSSIVFYKSPMMDRFDSFNVKLDELITDSLFLFTQFANLHVDNQGILHSTFSAFNNTEPVILVYHLISSDGSESFRNLLPVASHDFIFFNSDIPIVRVNPMPDAITHSPSNSIHIVYGDTNNGSSLNTVYQKSNDFGLTWSDPIFLSELLEVSFLQYLFSTIAYDEDSDRISISFFAQETDLTWNYYLTSSIDNGITWESPLKVSNIFTDFSDNNDLIFFGDYWESKMIGNKTYCVWTDGRLGSGAKIYFAVVDHNEPSSIVEITSISTEVNIQSVFPNPFENDLTINFDAKKHSDIEITIHDINSKKLFSNSIKSKVGQNEVTLNLEFLPSGSYLLSIKSDNGITSKRIVKQ